MKYSTILVALFVATATFSDAAQAANTYRTNPMGLAYKYTTNVSQYGRPGGMVIASGCNRYDPAFATARANGEEAQAWKDVQGVTHVSDQATYAQVTPPPIAVNRLTDRPRRFGRSSRGSLFTSPLVVNAKRGSRFTLTQKGTLLNMSAYVDGGGGPSGAQSLRMALYRDSNGVPGALVAQSNAMSVTAGSSSRWLYFPAGATALNPGTYWIMIHSGSTSAVTRIKGDGAANWHGNNDTYSDGAANPAGAGSLGTMTLSLFASYTVGYQEPSPRPLYGPVRPCNDAALSGVTDCDLISGHVLRSGRSRALMVFAHGHALISPAAVGKPRDGSDWQAVDVIRCAIKSRVFAVS